MNIINDLGLKIRIHKNGNHLLLSSGNGLTIEDDKKGFTIYHFPVSVAFSVLKVLVMKAIKSLHGYGVNVLSVRTKRTKQVFLSTVSKLEPSVIF